MDFAGGGEGFGGGRFDLQLREQGAQIGIVRARQPLRAFGHADANLGGGGARVSESQNRARRRALDQQAQNARRQKPCFAAARASRDDRAAARIERAAQIGGFHRARKEKSAAAMSFVIAPIDTQSIPAAAICARTDARAPPAASKPDASNFARPRFAAAARRICASEKLSSKTRQRPGGERDFELRQILDFDFDLGRRRDAARGGERGFDSARGANVIFFD